MGRWLRPRAVAVAGFAVMLVLMVELVAMGMARLDELTSRIDHIAYRQGAKMQATADLLDVTRQRSELLGVLLVDRTLRQQAEVYRRLEALGQRSTQLMDRLEALEQDPVKRLALEELLRTGRALERMRDAMATALQAGQINEALRLRLSQAAPAARFEELLTGAVSAQRAEMLAAMDEALAGARGAYLFLAVLGGGLLVIGAAVAVLVIRHIGRAEAALYREKERAEVALHSIAEGVITTDARGCIEVLNAVAEQLTGWRSAEARGLPLDAVYVVLDEESQKPLSHGFAAAAGRTLITRAAILKARDGRRIPVEESCSPIRGPDGTVTGLVVVFHDVSHVRAMAQRLTWQASHDSLTGLVNRREFERRLAYLLESAKTDGRKHALLYLDLDRFKAVNDTCGHVAGDELLRQLAAAMHVKIRGSDTLARLGGDEFGVLLEACPVDQAIRIANGLREIVRDFRFHWKDKTFSLGASIGLVMVDADSGTVADVLAAADASCYAAKEKGGSRVEMYQPGTALTRTPQGDVAMVHQITSALEKGGFRLYRQPIAPVTRGGRMPPLRSAGAHGGRIRPPARSQRFHAGGRALQSPAHGGPLGGDGASRLHGPGSATLGGRPGELLLHQPIRSEPQRQYVRRVPAPSDGGRTGAAPAAVLRSDRDHRHLQPHQGERIHARPAGFGLPLRPGRLRRGHVLLRLSQAPAGRLPENRRQLHP